MKKPDPRSERSNQRLVLRLHQVRALPAAALGAVQCGTAYPATEYDLRAPTPNADR
jgi:hypothetical protein